jgi:putative transposase
VAGQKFRFAKALRPEFPALRFLPDLPVFSGQKPAPGLDCIVLLSCDCHLDSVEMAIHFLIRRRKSQHIRNFRRAAQLCTALSAEVLLLRKQLAFYEERQVQPRRLNDSARFSLILGLAYTIGKRPWQSSNQRRLIGWHRKGFTLFWKWKSQVGRPRLPENIRKLIVQMAQENPTWGQARVSAELSVKLGIYVSPRTVRAYWPPEPGRRGHRRTSSQNWRTFVCNHAQSIIACDFLVVVTARFRTLYVFLLMEVGSRRIVHCSITAHPTAAWTLQQFREAIPSDHSHRFLLHDREAIRQRWTSSSRLLNCGCCARPREPQRRTPTVNV